MAIMVVFVVVSILFIVGCDKIIGPDEAALAEQSGSSEREEERMSR